MPLDPFHLGQLDAQRDRPRAPLYDSKADADAYVQGWRVAAPSRPAPDVLRRRPGLLSRLLGRH